MSSSPEQSPTIIVLKSAQVMSKGFTIFYHVNNILNLYVSYKKMTSIAQKQLIMMHWCTLHPMSHTQVLLCPNVRPFFIILAASYIHFFPMNRWCPVDRSSLSWCIGAPPTPHESHTRFVMSKSPTILYYLSVEVSFFCTQNATKVLKFSNKLNFDHTDILGILWIN